MPGRFSSPCRHLRVALALGLAVALAPSPAPATGDLRARGVPSMRVFDVEDGIP